MWMTDPKTKKKSVTMTVFVVTFAVCIMKLMFSGLAWGDFSIPQFGGTDFATCVAAAGAIYFGRKYTDANNASGNPEER